MRLRLGKYIIALDFWVKTPEQIWSEGFEQIKVIHEVMYK